MSRRRIAYGEKRGVNKVRWGVCWCPDCTADWKASMLRGRKRARQQAKKEIRNRED